MLLGPLPVGFLQTAPSGTADADYQIAMAMEHQVFAPRMQAPPGIGRLSMTIVQAKLVKNYGLTRMDPYVRVRVGHCIYETHTDPSGGKTPRWNKVAHCLLPPGVNSAYLEIYDECSFTMDELIAWAHITIPAAVMNGETHEDWYPLNGKQGDGMEGMINLVLSYSIGPGINATITRYPQVVVVPQTGLGYTTMPVYPEEQRCPRPQEHVERSPPEITPEQLKQLSEMFPKIEQEVIKSVYQFNQGDKVQTINSLLLMSQTE